MRQHQVTTFARYAELLGGQSLAIELPDPATVADLILALRSLPGGDSLPATPLVAVNLELADRATPVRPGDALALLPPLAGG
jgi:molybdopterin converting factor small subunit